MSVKISADDTTLWQAKWKVFQYPVTEIGSQADNVLPSTAQPFPEAKAFKFPTIHCIEKKQWLEKVIWTTHAPVAEIYIEPQKVIGHLSHT